MKICDKEITIEGGIIKVARLSEEWYEDLEDPVTLIKNLKTKGVKADLFTFWQRLPETEPKYTYFKEWDSIAAIDIKSYDNWWKNQINAKTRNVIRKAEKKGVTIREAEFNDEFVMGMTSIFNEAPIRQGKPFWHYGKSFDTVKKEFSRYLFREDLIGAYYKGELIGFIMLAYAGKYAITGQIIAKIEHRDKAPVNALIAKAVKICADKNLSHLVYAKWDTGTLGNFKRHNGFEKIDLPRYYVPLSAMGRIILKLKLHHGFAGMIPDNIKQLIKNNRMKRYRKTKS